MNFTISQSLLLKNLNVVQGGITKGQNEISTIKITAAKGKIIIETNNRDMEIIATSECVIEQEGEIFVEAIQLFEIIKKLPAGAPIKIEQKFTLLHITHEKSRFNINLLKDLIQLSTPLLKADISLRVRSKKLLFLLEKTKFSIFPNDTRLSLSGLLLQLIEQNEGKDFFLRAVSTDGHRLSLADLQAEDIISTSFPENEIPKKGVILPKKSVLELKKILESIDDEEVEIKITGKRVRFEAGPFELLTTLVDAEFPQYAKVIPEIKENIVIIPRKELLTRVERVGAIYGGGDKNILRMTFENNILTLFGKNNECGEAIDEMPVEWKDEKMEIAYKYSYVVEILNHVSSDNIRISLKSGSATLIKDEKLDNYFYVLMPIRF